MLTNYLTTALLEAGTSDEITYEPYIHMGHAPNNM